jgi:hypothetical protein
MTNLRFVRTSFRVCALLVLLGLSVSGQQAPPVSGPITGANVNMVSGTTLPTGDPYLRQQNGPTLAPSTRNPLHMLAGANDYRTVDYPGGDIGHADAWMGVFKSFDGGKSWTSSLLPGFPQDKSPEGLASPAHGWKAGSDVVVRAGTNGLFYYVGMAFNREPNPAGIIFTARFIDNNNKENADSIQYIDTVQIGRGRATAFLDKPWVAVDVPRLGARLCTVRTRGADGKQIVQTFPGGNVYVAYTIADFFNVNTETSRIMLTHSTNCGATWSDPVRLSGPNTINQGATIAIDPNDGDVYVAWRQFYTIDPKTKKVNEAGAIMVAKSTNEGLSFSKPVSIPDADPFIRPRLPGPAAPNLRSFRANGYAVMTVDNTGRVYMAWPQWTGDDIRVAISTSRNGVSNWSKLTYVDPPPAGMKGYQAMPSLTFAGGKLAVAFYDFRNDWLAGFTTVLGLVVDLAPDQPLWHVIDVRVATATPGDMPQFKSTRISKYHYKYAKDPAGNITGLTQLDYNAPNYPLFAEGTTPYIGDYIDISPSPPFVTDFIGRWIYNTAATDVPVFHAAWSDNRDVLPPKDGNWALYKVPGSMCTDPVVRVGMRNQNIYSSEISEGLVVSSPGNTKPIGRIQRAFVIWVKNTTGRERTFRLSTETLPFVTQASFLQFERRPSMDVIIGARSSIARAVYVTSFLPRVPVRVKVVEIDGVGKGVTPGGLQSSTVLNRDLLNPPLLDPDLPPGSLLPPIENAEDYSPDILEVLLNPNQPDPKNLDPNVFAQLVAAGLADADILNPDILNPDILNPDILNPDILNPDILNPDILNPDIPNADPNKIAVQDISWETTNVGNTTSAFTFKTVFKNRPLGFNFQLLIYRLSYTTGLDPKTCKVVNIPHQELLVNVRNPEILNPDILNPDILNPNVQNATYYAEPGETIKIKLRVLNLDKDVNQITVTNSSGLTRTLTADGGKAVQELIVAPLDRIAFNGEPLNAAVVAHEVNTEDAEDGVTQPPVATTALTVTTASLPLAQQNAPYSRQLLADGGVTPYVWTITQGAQALNNAGLTLSSTGLLSSARVTQFGTFPFTVEVRDSSTPVQIATADLVLVVKPPSGQATLLFVTPPSTIRAGDPITPPPSVQALNAAGNPVSGITVTIRLMNGSTDASVNFGAGSTTQATTNSNGIAAFSNVVINVPGTTYRLAAATGSTAYQPTDSASFVVLGGVAIAPSPVIPDGVVGRLYPGVTFTATGGLPPRTWSVINPSLMPPGLSLNPATGAISGTPTAAGTFTFTIRVDDAGAPAQSDTRSVTMRIGMPLAIQDASPIPNAFAGQRYVQAFNITGGIGTRSCTVTPLNPVPGVGFDNSTCTFDGISTTPGNYPFTLRTTDQSSPVQNATKDFMLRVIDNVPPSVSIIAPAPNARVQGMTVVTASATDNVGVAAVQFLLDGANLGAPVPAPGPFTITWDASQASAGPHTLSAMATDVAGNQRASAPVPVIVEAASARVLAYYPFEGSPEDASGNGFTFETRDVQYQNGALVVNGVYEHSSPPGYRAQTPNIPALNYDNFTISADFNADADAAGRPILAGGVLYRWVIVDLTSSRELVVSLNNRSVPYPTGQFIQTGRWYNVAVSLDLSTRALRLFLDGQTILNETLPAGFELDVIRDNIQNAKMITLENYSSGTAYKGMVDNLQIYDRALTQVPAIASLNPNHQETDGGATDVVITGASFDPGATVVSTNSAAARVSSVNITSATSIRIGVSPTAAGATTFHVTNPDGGRATSTPFVVIASPPSTTLSAASCSQEPSLKSIVGDTLTLIVFTNGSTQSQNLYWLNYSGARVLYATIAPGTSLAQQTYLTHPWVVTDSLNNCLAIYMPTEGSANATTTHTGAPALTAMTPAGGPRGSSVQATLAGSNFVTGATVVAVSGTGVTGTNVNVTNSTSLNVTFAIDPNASPGDRSVTVSTSAGTSAPLTFSVAVPFSSLPFSIPNQGGLSASTMGSSNPLMVGYATIQPDAQLTTPPGVAIMGFSSGNILRTEAAVPASRLFRTGRMHVEIDGGVRTGISVVNPHTVGVTVTLSLTTSGGTASANLTLSPNQHTSKFVDELFVGSGYQGTLTVTGTSDLVAVGIRSVLNEQGGFLLTTTPVFDTARFGGALLASLADGGGKATDVVLVNLTDQPAVGTVQLFDSDGARLTLTANGETLNTFAYNLAARASFKLSTAGSGAVTRFGSVRIVPNFETRVPAAFTIQSSRRTGNVVSVVGITSLTTGRFRMYVEDSGAPPAAGTIESLVAVSNTISGSATVTFELTDLSGTLLANRVVRVIPGNGQLLTNVRALFSGQTLPPAFKGVLRILSSDPALSVSGLRVHYNQAGDGLYASIPPADESAQATSELMWFPHIASGGGFTEEFILFSRAINQGTAGAVRFFDQAGRPMTLDIVP